MPQFIDDNSNGETPMVYNSILVSPRNLSIFGSELCLKIVKELAKKPGCAMDMARKLEQHEQKIYYHLRNLERAGIIKQIRTEQRYGMTAKIYAVVSPVVSTRLYNDGYPIEEAEAHPRDPKVLKFLHPFVKDGKLIAKIIMGDPYPHGEFNEGAKSAVHSTDFMILIGKITDENIFQNYKLDVHVTEEDLKNNLILIGNPKENTIMKKIAPYMPIKFSTGDGFSFTSNKTEKVYGDPRIGLIIKCKNPFNKNKRILMICGVRTRGVKAAVISLTEKFSEFIENINFNEDMIRIVEGFDKNGDGEIDSVKILE